MERNQVVRVLVGLRMVAGGGAWLTPRAAGKLFGLDPRGNPQAPYLARLFGARDFALAAGLLGTEGDAQRQWLVAGLACDVADALAGIAGGRGGYLPAVTTVLVTSAAISGAALGAVALRGNTSTA